MAHPIFSFIDRISRKRFYQSWDTTSGYPETIPMNFFTFLQFYGFRNLEFINTLHQIYPDLISTGTSLSEDASFETLSNPFKQQAFDAIQAAYLHPEKKLDELSQDLEILFKVKRDFKEFYIEYSKFIQSLNPHPILPKHYYASWSYTVQIFNDMKNEGKALILNHIDDQSYIDFESWFINGWFENKRETLISVFYDLALKNHIEIGSIPHIFRDDHRIVELFKAYGMVYLLPSFNPHYNPYIKPYIQLKIDNKEENIRQFLNYCAFSDFPFGKHIRGIELQELDKIQLTGLLEENFINGSIINFYDDQDNLIHPFKYTNFHLEDNAAFPFQFFAEFGMQSAHVFLKDGTLIDTSGYEDISFVDENSYIGMMDYLSGYRCVFDFNEFKLTKTPIKFNPETQEILEVEIKKEKEDNVITENQSNANNKKSLSDDEDELPF